MSSAPFTTIEAFWTKRGITGSLAEMRAKFLDRVTEFEKEMNWDLQPPCLEVAQRYARALLPPPPFARPAFPDVAVHDFHGRASVSLSDNCRFSTSIRL